MIKMCFSFPIQIFIAGDIHTAAAIARQYCDEVGYCVTVSPTKYVYRDGEEDGVIIGLINYPRFPSNAVEMTAHAKSLADRLLAGLNQQSYSIQSPWETIWVSHREEDN